LVPVGISYDSDPKEVRDLLLAVAQRHNLVQAEPDPAVHFMGFGDSSLDFRLAIWMDDPLLMLGVASDLHFMIFKALAERNIEIPFPQRDLHIRSGVPWEMSS
jgi:small-conductance mechanosensitive channel